nr:immunoglobulin heavy chain junction region [Mus musculus]
CARGYYGNYFYW